MSSLIRKAVLFANVAIIIVAVLLGPAPSNAGLGPANSTSVIAEGPGIAADARSITPSNRGEDTGTQQRASDDVVRLKANLVTVPTVVMDPDGRYITDLRKGDFQIFEDEVEQDVSFFSPVDEPFTILFLLDTSGSMTSQMVNLAHAANGLFSQLRPHDTLIVALFNDRVDVLCEATRIDKLRKDAKFRLHNSGNSSMIYDAVDYALKRMKKVDGRKAIVLFSDGFGSGIVASAKRNLRDAEEQNGLIYTVQFNARPAQPPRFVSKKAYLLEIEEGNNYMRDLAQKTGGRLYQLDSTSDLGKAFGLVAEELRRQYSLGYYPKKPAEAGQMRQIKVKVRSPNLVVRARSSYVIGHPRHD